MVRTRECNFCGDDIEPGTGTMFVRVDGTTEHFCSAKCERSDELGREPRNVGWTEAGRQAAEANRAADEARQEAAAEAEAESEPEPEEAEVDAEDEAESESADAEDEADADTEESAETEEETEA
ncbi:50S ribosomal protein L24e [Haloglomus salinum]|jgi:large subunit ribosomal protein L24e|uniref:50S ribosomal protein L24e n=1 Tax=Haloglomus salinum TaxID=2962673 RepID=UPI0020C9D4CC|nr:50S ribosomal protein L24e [Haloglomus salinum]